MAQFNIDSLPYVACSHQTPRGSKINLLVVHTNEGPESPKGAEGLASYLHSANVVPGYHIVVDEDSAIRCAQDTQRVNGAGGVNDRSLHICLIGFAAQTREQWLDPASKAELDIARELVRQWTVRHGIPWVHLTPEQVRDGVYGICGHGDVSKYHPESMGHTDPGAGFPWDLFMAPAVPKSKENEVRDYVFVQGDEKDAAGKYTPKADQWWLTDWLTATRVVSPAHLSFLAYNASVTAKDAAGVPDTTVRRIPQAYVDALVNE